MNQQADIQQYLQTTEGRNLTLKHIVSNLQEEARTHSDLRKNGIQKLIEADYQIMTLTQQLSNIKESIRLIHEKSTTEGTLHILKTNLSKIKAITENIYPELVQLCKTATNPK